MGDKENNIGPTTRLSKKRAFESNPLLDHQSMQQFSKTKKRVPLGNLTNRANFGINQKPNPGAIKNPKFKKTEKREKNKGHEPAEKSSEEKAEEPVKKSEIVSSLIDKNNCDYALLMYQHLQSLEVEEGRRPLANYLEKVQKDVNQAMRDILLDWLVEVAEEYKLISDTLYLTVYYIDRFLSQHSISRNKLQLLGVSSMLVASKYEEISPPRVEDFCYITDNTYSREEVVKMERDVLKFLNFEMGTPTIKTFLRIFTRIAQEKPDVGSLQMEFLGCYLAELSLLDYGCLRFLPSMSLTLQHCSGYRPLELRECVLAIHALQLSKQGKSFQAVRDKYSQHQFKFVAALSYPSEVPASFFECIDE